MGNVPVMTGWGREALVSTGYKTADLLEDSFFEHGASLFLSSSSLLVLPAKDWVSRDVCFCTCCYWRMSPCAYLGGAARATHLMELLRCVTNTFAADNRRRP